MIFSKCPICGEDKEAFLEQQLMTAEDQLMPCSDCAERFRETKIMVTDKDGDRFVFMNIGLFEKIFNRLPEDGVAMVSKGVYDKILGLFANLKSSFKNMDENACISEDKSVT